jgi:hypothetical protein
MKRVFFLTPLALAAMTGCAPAPNQIQAGQWEITTEVRGLEIPGATPDQVRMIQRSAGQVGMSDTESRCLSDAEARSFVQDIRSAPPTCQVSGEVYANGVMTTHVSCPSPNGPPIQISLDGRFTASTLNATVNVEGPNPTGANQGPMRRIVRLRGRRTGECTAPPPGALPAMPVPAQPAPPPGQSAPAPQPPRS